MQFGKGDLGCPPHGATLDDPGARVAREGSNVRSGYVEKGARQGECL
jgi:hypothetical protein